MCKSHVSTQYRATGLSVRSIAGPTTIITSPLNVLTHQLPTEVCRYSCSALMFIGVYARSGCLEARAYSMMVIEGGVEYGCH